MKQQSLFSLTDVGRAITNLCGAMYYSSYQHDPALCNVSYRTLLVSEEQHLQLLKQQNKRKRNAAVASVAVNADYSLGDPALHLFLYAVLMNRKELAMIFWKELTVSFLCPCFLRTVLLSCHSLPLLILFSVSCNVNVFKQFQLLFYTLR